MNRVREALGVPAIQEFDGRGVTVAIVDSGADVGHPDLKGAIDLTRSRSFRPGGSTEDGCGHGTHIAGIIAGAGARNPHYRGIAPGVKVVVLTALHSDGKGNSSAVAEAILYAADIGADVINLSLGANALEMGGGPGPWIWSNQQTAIELAVRDAVERGSLCVCAAGNCGPELGTVELPGAIEEALCVGALNREGSVAGYSGRGPFYRSADVRLGAVRSDGPPQIAPALYMKPDIVLPGGGDIARRPDVLGTMGFDRQGLVSAKSRHSSLRPASALDGDRAYTAMTGTSQAAAVASGMAALILHYAKVKGLDLGKRPAFALGNLIRASAMRDNLGADTGCGRGRLTWTRLKDQVEGCLSSSHMREMVLGGEAPKLML